jgi:tRNA threonylcarbamoyladenosine biosynthesis protein TsaB
VILLGIESATELVGVALSDDAGPRASFWITGRRRHGETLAPAIAHVLEQSGTDLADVDALCVDVGPGLFTGLRVGVATAKGLAQALGVGVVTVSSVDVLAREGSDGGWDGPLVAIVDARRGEVFAARYLVGPSAGRGGMTETGPASRWTPAELAADLAGEAADVGAGPRRILAVGDGAVRYAAELAAVPGLRVAGGSAGSPSPAALVALAAERLAAGAVPSPPADVVPLYLRDADVRIQWAQRRPVPDR